MPTGRGLQKRSNSLAHTSQETPIKSASVAEKTSKAQRVLHEKSGARLTAKKTCENMSGTFWVLNIIQNSEEGVDPRTLKQMTGYNKKKVYKILYKLFKRGEIRIEAGGLYTRVEEHISGSPRQLR